MLEFIYAIGNKLALLVIIIGLAVIMFEETNRLNKK